MLNRLKISIITPSLNQGQFIEDTILSVLNQKYDNFEHIIIDGGSTDNTINILKKYNHLIWVSEKDSGQSNAINKGFKLATGDIIAWLNSDDYYEENIFEEVQNYFQKTENCFFLYGDITFVNENKAVINKVSGNNLSYKNIIKNPDIVRQPSSFWRRSLLNEIGYLDEKLDLVMDLDFFLRIGQKHEFYYLNRNLSFFRAYNENKTSSQKRKQYNEIKNVLKKHAFFLGFRTYKLLLGRYLDSLNDDNILKKMLQPLRKKKLNE
jgi:glycosyltransferase involved in cell wall biosynthesis